MKLRRSEIAILAFGAAFLVLLAIYFRPGQRPAAASGRSAAGRGISTGSAEEGQPTTLLSGFDYTESVGEKPLFRIRSERTVGFGTGAGLPPNWYALEKVSLTVYPEQGSPVTVYADRARYDDRTKAAVLSGNVRWVEPRDGSLGETEKIEFEPGGRVLRAPGPLHFVRGTFDLTAASGSYDVGRRLLALHGPIRGSGSGQGSGGLSSLSADAGEYRRDEGVLELRGNVALTSAKGDRLAANRLVLKFSAQGNEPEWARAFGAVRGTFAPASTAASPVPAGALPAPRGSSPAPAAGERTYSAQEAALFFDPSGEVRSISLTGRPAMVTDPGRQLAARSIDIEFAAGRPVSARASGEVRLRSDQGNAESERASASFDSTGGFQTLELEGAVRIEGEGRTGRAGRVVDVSDRGVWLLMATRETPASVEERGSKVSASRIEIDRNRKSMRAEGGARAVFVSEKDRPAQATALLGDPSRPTYGKAERMVLDRDTRVASLSGAASLWQDASSLSADDITLNDAERTVVAVGKVRAALKRPPAAGGKEEPPAIVTARRLVYRESESTAVFEDAVALNRGTWRATADRGVARFAKDRKLERVELSGNVQLADRATGRTATADRAIDDPAEGRTVLHGSPARVSDADGNRVAGSTLTITGRGKNVEVTAAAGGRTETVHKTKAD